MESCLFFARNDFLLGHLCIDQMIVHISVFFVGLEYANDRDFCSQFGIVGRIAMLAREDELQQSPASMMMTAASPAPVFYSS